MQSFTPFLVVAVALIDADGRVLVQQRPPGKPMADLWEFPGGKVERGETPEAALVRELEEELGIRTHESCLAPATFASAPLENKHLLLLLYVCRKWEGMPEARHATALQWVRPAQMYALDMPPADLPLIGILDALI
ncbi:(deoxy)nucleoside triphosphate pyrophosphohydrolase [Sphingobium sp. PAMC28499]|jgi:8-oxo-dGTP diphosphatase|uniref:(deoxy)nucleoside triphosphate pyrophosphohydrolase n=1 Tax=Sphingobium sp. PAMC28499 TaxID=2565554 RepID=UPI000F7F04EA|nr:(deoxy)nucleoside triphosphate pyrophosphohydrolase [Sphingobium sp. PAMC28499]QCB39877.1 (deoxy)nucleoside triphosphate pyrophosphohydrolase [Sphingobium sp. PAMC28499]RSU80226.1 8-oxo-dGTP diphosphatase MutT [Sphingomonas sp. S-NIH.Pt3_0716]